MVMPNNDARTPIKTVTPITGGRGIKFLFESLTQFIEHIGMKPSPKLTLDRIDSDGNYEIGNVRWASWKQQAATRRKPCKK